ncbi:hypothetical protein DY245_12130 [Streptomyces inhibens]|uniref:Uncharacterized protein n=1 Tax=Streptomyces inhibens TaxID=2293571 RepID=A0A371Q610_STRIH|nr:hypothetical protein [Streptomyces inhibens]REK90101.1 hypothetical protein DY245_12130 [Streptomyces inhibens]
MADEDSNAAPCLSALPHPSAAPGYGKRSAPDQQRSRPGDFAHLPRREASIAAYLDRLPEGADISVKTLAKVLPDYGQCALRTALRRLSEAGHLRRVTEHHTSDGGSPLWVTRTYFSRTARDDAWWMALCAGNVPMTDDGETSAADPPRQPRPHSRAYATLAALGRAEPRMTLSAADCASLEAFAEEWLARGATPDQLVAALTSGLPTAIHHPGRLARSRLLAKMPPVVAAEPTSPVPSAKPVLRLRIMECTVCRAPGRPESLPGGVCGPCRGEAPPDHGPAGPTAAQVRAHVRHLRRTVAVSRP